MRILEEQICAVWRQLGLESGVLQTVDQREVEVLSPGVRNLDAGPDFSESVIRINGILRRGCVEIHTRASHWREHGHHRDEKYNAVILHVVWLNDVARTLRQDGSNVPVVRLQGQIDSGRLAFDFEREGATAYCHLPALEPQRRLALIETHGLNRFRMKGKQFSEEVASDGWEQVLYRGIMEALGYSKNQVPFRKLADRLPVHVIAAEATQQAGAEPGQVIRALLMGGAGLLPGQGDDSAGIDSQTRAYVQPLELLHQGLAAKLGLKSMKRSEWQFFRLRPVNFPTRRLAGMVEVLRRHSQTGLFEGLLAVLKQDLTPRQVVRELEARFLVEGDDFWRSHCDFVVGAASTGAEFPATLIGKSRARDVVINVVLPMFYQYAEAASEGALLGRIQEVLRAYPRHGDNELTRKMTGQILPPDAQTRSPIKSALLQQGVLQLAKLHCPELRCRACLQGE